MAFRSFSSTNKMIGRVNKRYVIPKYGQEKVNSFENSTKGIASKTATPIGYLESFCMEHMADGMPSPKQKHS